MIPKIGTPGQVAENKAAKFLVKKGLVLIQKNFHCRHGEIDLIMRDKEVIVFVEVRFRHNNHYGNGAESVTIHKQSKLIKTAQTYLMKNKLDEVACRFDVIGLSGNLKKPEIEWLVNAINQ